MCLARKFTGEETTANVDLADISCGYCNYR